MYSLHKHRARASYCICSDTQTNHTCSNRGGTSRRSVCNSPSRRDNHKWGRHTYFAPRPSRCPFPRSYRRPVQTHPTCEPASQTCRGHCRPDNAGDIQYSVHISKPKPNILCKLLTEAQTYITFLLFGCIANKTYSINNTIIKVQSLPEGTANA